MAEEKETETEVNESDIAIEEDGVAQCDLDPKLTENELKQSGVQRNMWCELIPWVIG